MIPACLGFAAQRGQAPSDKAWRRLSAEVNMRLLCLFMVADREDCPGGWRANEPTTWFIAEAQRRGLIGQLVLDTHDHPSVISAGGVVIHDGRAGRDLKWSLGPSQRQD